MVRPLAEVIDGGQHVLYVHPGHRATHDESQAIEDHSTIPGIDFQAIRMVHQPLDRLWQIDRRAPCEEIGEPLGRFGVAAQSGKPLGPGLGIGADDYGRTWRIGMAESSDTSFAEFARKAVENGDTSVIYSLCPRWKNGYSRNC